jgi:hypothetical protein
LVVLSLAVLHGMENLKLASFCKTMNKIEKLLGGGLAGMGRK